MYNGDNELLAFSDSTSLGGSGTPALIRRSLYGPGANQIIATDNYQNTVLWAAVNQVGSVCYVVKNDGTIVDHRTYDSFGNVQEYNASGVNVTDHGRRSPAVSPLPSPGQAYSLTAGLYYAWHRVYDSLTGQYTTSGSRLAGHESLRLLRRQSGGEFRS